jgi:hypothetical protein
MPTYTVIVQREPEQSGDAWTDDTPYLRFDGHDAVDAALTAFRELRVMPKRQRLLLWETPDPAARPRIFHPGS